MGNENRADDVALPNPNRRWGSHLLAVLFLVMTLSVIVVYVIIWVDPQTPLNVFAPSTPFVYVTATP
jgi:hypothetical protein